MKVDVIVNSLLGENTYIISKNNKCLIIDPGSDKDKILDFIEKNKLKVLAILVTHYHFDHIYSLDYLSEKLSCKTIDYKCDELCVIDEFKFKIVLCPGHTNDSCFYYFYLDNIMFSGDFLFRGSIGKFDDEEVMFNSLKTIKSINKKCIVYPGHGDKTTISEELTNNIFLRGI